MCGSSAKNSDNWYRSLMNKAKKAVSVSMGKKAEEWHTAVNDCTYGMLRLVRTLLIDSKEGDGGRSMRGSDGKLSLNEKKRGRVLKDCIERIVNEEDHCDHRVEEDAVGGPVDCK